MNYDFDYYSGGHLSVPQKPVKPTIGRNPSAIEARAWAEALEEYESALASYNENLGWYRSEKAALLIKFQDNLRTDYDLEATAFDAIWSEAWDRGYSGGLHEVYHEFDRLFEFLEKYEKATKK